MAAVGFHASSFFYNFALEMEVKCDMNHDGPIRIDVGAVLRSRLGSRKVPSWLVWALEKLIRQEQMNVMLEYAFPRRGADFCAAVIEHLGIKTGVTGTNNFPSNGRAIFVSNHPLGGLDGMTLIKLIADRYGREPLFVVNDLLMAVEPLADVFLPVNKHGAQTRKSICGIDSAMASDRPIIIFPAGLCSRKQGGRIADLEWKKMFVQKAVEFKRDIVPMYFGAVNSPSFYRWANIRKRLGIKLNIEMVLLPGEIFKSEGKTFTVSVAPPVSWQSLPGDARAGALMIRRITYGMADKQGLFEIRDRLKPHEPENYRASGSGID